MEGRTPFQFDFVRKKSQASNTLVSSGQILPLDSRNPLERSLLLATWCQDLMLMVPLWTERIEAL